MVINEPGTYTLLYTATDDCGNETTESRTVTVQSGGGQVLCEVFFEETDWRYCYDDEEPIRPLLDIPVGTQLKLSYTNSMETDPLTEVYVQVKDEDNSEEVGVFKWVESGVNTYICINILPYGKYYRVYHSDRDCFDAVNEGNGYFKIETV